MYKRFQKIITILTLITLITSTGGEFFISRSYAAETVVPITQKLPQGKDMSSLLEHAPETFDIDNAELLICESDLYANLKKVLDAVQNAIKKALNFVVKNVISQIPVIGTLFSIFGGGGSPPATGGVNAGGADTVMECKKWIQAKKATIKAKAAEMMKIYLKIAARRFMDRMVSDTVDWISGRTTGEPQFVTNWRDFFSDVNNEAFGYFIENSPFSDLCEPFHYFVRQKIALPGKPPFPRCTLSMVVNNIEAFYDNFANGGWLAFEESYYPWNDAFGAWMMTQEAAETELAAAKEEAEKKTQSGYKPTELCVEYKTDPQTGAKHCVKKLVSIPGQNKSDLTSKALTNQMEQADKYFITADTWTQYGAMIAQAIISRLLKSAKEVLVDGKWYGKGLLDLPKEGEKGENLPMKYSCKTYDKTKVCEMDPTGGTYSSLESCEASCTGVVSKFRCDSELKMCVADENGTYSNYLTCSQYCYPEEGSTTTPSLENRFTCTDDGQCIPDANGEFTSMASCTKYCHPQTEEGKGGVTPPSY